jgi:hypothetical protein
MSANAYYRELQSLGLGARRSEVLQLYKIAKSITIRSPEEAFRDISRVPHDSELQPWPTKTATGVAQNITLTYRDKVTGKIKQTWYRTVSDNGIPREDAMAAAIDAYSDHAESYGQELIGAVHTSAYRLTPVNLG